jgi:hypothetical protein
MIFNKKVCKKIGKGITDLKEEKPPPFGMMNGASKR